ncbi:MAG: hypothetical protein AAGG07_00915 [Planctomycetota bacterium]
MSLDVAINPYHLTRREPAAMASVLLADRCATLIPGDGEDRSRDELEQAAQDTPVYAELVRQWGWTAELFRAGVLCPAPSAAACVRSAAESIEADERLAALRPLMKGAMHVDDGAYLRALAEDMIKGGPDPALMLPVAAGLDRFAREIGAFSVRSDGTSLAQRTEARLATKLFAIGVPVLLQASAERVLEARDELSTELDELRDALVQMANTAQDAIELDGLDAAGVRAACAGSRADLNTAARAYSSAFDTVREELTRPEDPDTDLEGMRVIASSVTMTAVTLPGDAVLRSSASAARSLTRVAPRSSAATLAQTRTPARVRSLVVKVLGK